MPRMTDKMIDSGDPFPSLEVDQVGGGKISLPGDLAGRLGSGSALPRALVTVLQAAAYGLRQSGEAQRRRRQGCCSLRGHGGGREGDD